MSKLPKSVTAYKSQSQANWRAKKRAAGLAEVTVWVPSTDREKLAAYCERLRREYEKTMMDGT